MISHRPNQLPMPGYRADHPGAGAPRRRRRQTKCPACVKRTSDLTSSYFVIEATTAMPDFAARIGRGLAPSWGLS